jgi:hypothetical protein
MINKIIDGIIDVLTTEFGDGYEVYTENIEQGLEEPCFSIRCLNPTNKQFFGKRYFRTNQFCIHYFPQSSETQSERFAVLERLFRAMEYITVDGDLTRGTEMKSEWNGDVLHFFVNYDMFVDLVEDEDNFMESLEQYSGVKGR